MQVKVFTFNPFQENTYLLYDETGEAVIIDPGCYDKPEQSVLEIFVAENNLNVVALWNTHCHVDHVLGNAFVKEKFGVKLHIHPEGESVLKSVENYAPAYGFIKYHAAEADEFFEEGDVLTFGNQRLKVLFTPGHCPGHVVFYHEESGQCINGDVLFREGIGRVDLPGGNASLLLERIKSQLFTLPENTIVHCGHGPSTTIGHEKENNPFCGKNAIYQF